MKSGHWKFRLQERLSLSGSIMLLIFLYRFDRAQEIFGCWPQFHVFGFVIGVNGFAIFDRPLEIGAGESISARDERAVNQEELAFEPMRERAAHGCLASPWWAVQQHSPLRPQPETIRQLIILERKHNIDFQIAKHIIHAFKVF